MYDHCISELHVSEDNIYGVDNMYVLIGPKDPVVLCDKCFEDLCFRNKYSWGGRRERRKNTKCSNSFHWSDLCTASNVINEHGMDVSILFVSFNPEFCV